MELLLARLGNQHPQRAFLERELYWTTAGTRGESRLQKKFNEFYWEEEFQVIWDVSLKMANWPIQMDGLLLTKRGAVIIESKNISGQLHFDEKTGEFFRINSAGEKTIMEDPRVQLNKNIRFLTQFFKAKKINLPVSGLIVFTAKDCEFASKPHRAFICKTYQMIEYLIRILQAFPLEVENVKLAKIKKVIMTNQAPYKQSPLCTYYFIDPKDLRPGVYCRHCKSVSMVRTHHSWICSKCSARDPSAHLLAIQEYFTFVEPEITNRKLRDFCGFESRAVATRLLSQLNLKRVGNLKTCSYHLLE